MEDKAAKEEAAIQCQVLWKIAQWHNCSFPTITSAMREAPRAPPTVDNYKWPFCRSKDFPTEPMKIL